MRVFLTGATGFIGSRIVPDLLARGHRVLGLTRSDAGAGQLEAAGADVHRGDLEHPEGLAEASREADAVIHCAFDHDFTNFAANCAKDTRAIELMGEALKGTGKPFLFTSGVGIGLPPEGGPAREDVLNTEHPNPRTASEVAGARLQQEGVNIGVVRLPQVHDTHKQGLITPLLDVIRAKGRAAYVGEGKNRWSAAHVDDVARLYVLAIERGEAGARYHAVDEEGVPAKAIAEALARGLNIPAVSVSPDQVFEEFGWMAMFVTMDLPASAGWTQETLGWTPTGPSLLEDLAGMDYTALAA